MITLCWDRIFNRSYEEKATRTTDDPDFMGSDGIPIADPNWESSVELDEMVIHNLWLAGSGDLNLKV